MSQDKLQAIVDKQAAYIAALEAKILHVDLDPSVALALRELRAWMSREAGHVQPKDRSLFDAAYSLPRYLTDTRIEQPAPTEDSIEALIGEAARHQCDVCGSDQDGLDMCVRPAQRAYDLIRVQLACFHNWIEGNTTK